VSPLVCFEWARQGCHFADGREWLLSVHSCGTPPPPPPPLNAAIFPQHKICRKVKRGRKKSGKACDLGDKGCCLGVEVFGQIAGVFHWGQGEWCGSDRSTMLRYLYYTIQLDLRTAMPCFFLPHLPFLGLDLGFRFICVCRFWFSFSIEDLGSARQPPKSIWAWISDCWISLFGKTAMGWTVPLYQHNLESRDLIMVFIVGREIWGEEKKWGKKKK